MSHHQILFSLERGIFDLACISSPFSVREGQGPPGQETSQDSIQWVGEECIPMGNQSSSIADGGWILGKQNNKCVIPRREGTLGQGLSMASCGAGAPGRLGGL